MATTPSSDMIDAIPQIVQGAPAYTPPDPNVAVDTPLGMRDNPYRPSKPNTLLTAAASPEPMMVTPLRYLSPPPTIAAVPQIIQGTLA
eukprot:scaffold7741_cov46-Attheya_sp.AAC.1